MERRKSVGVKWTLILFVVILCPFVYSRPQDLSTSSSSTTNSQTDKATENPIRYRHRQSFSTSILPIVIGFVNNKFINPQINKSTQATKNKNLDLFSKNGLHDTALQKRNRMLTKTVVRGNNNGALKNKPKKRVSQEKNVQEEKISSSRKPVIKKVITKWTDETKYEDFDFSREYTKSTKTKGDAVTFSNSLSLEEFSSTESAIDQSIPTEKRPHPYYPNTFYNKPYTELESEEQNYGVVHSNKVHIIEYPFPSVRPAYVFTTPMPTPIITNLGDPRPWNSNNIVKNKPLKPVRKKPLKDQYNYHNSVHNNYPQRPGPDFEVTTFQPHNAYTERIVIRPEEYAASDDCPTLFLTLNNTFQGQGKEACPDLNIAVNTNVVNKNVVVESEEEDSLFPGGFGLPVGEDSEADDAAATADYFDSEETPGEENSDSASIEPQGLSNYNAGTHDGSSEGGHGSHGSHASLGGGKPGKPNDDDEFSLSGMVSFFKPAINAMSWLAAISPFSFSIISMLLTPIAMLLAGYSGAAALFAPLGLAREAHPKIVHVYRPKWEWDDKYKTWYLNSFPNNRRWRPPRFSRNSKEEFDNNRSGSIKPTLFYKLKEWMKEITHRLNDKGNKKKPYQQQNRKNIRKKRKAWTKRIK